MVPRNAPGPSLSRPHFRHRASARSKASLVSPTPSAEGDDEESSANGNDDFFDEDDEDEDDDGGEGEFNVHLYDPHSADTMTGARYEQEDTRPTSQKELAGWYSYGWAAEVFAICAMGSFLPITLEQMARDQGVLLYDKSKSCRTSWPTMSSSAIADDVLPASHKPGAQPACVIRLGQVEINTASFAMYVFSISVLIQSLLIVSMSGAADHGRFRKTFLLLFGFLGGIALTLFIFVLPKLYLLGALLAIVTNTCFGASFVLLNSFLPVLVRYHPSVRSPPEHPDEQTPLGSDARVHVGYNTAGDASRLLPAGEADHLAPASPARAPVSPELSLSTKISAYGIGIGYTAGLLVQTVAICVVIATGSTTFSLRLVLTIIGLWWCLFTVPAALWLRPRPGPPLPASLARTSGWVGYVTYAWKSLFRTMAQARRLKDITIFLAAWFLLSDSIATVSGTAVLFAKTNLGMKPQALGLINVIATVAGVVGAFSWSAVSRALGLRASQTIVACVCLFEIIPLYGLLGFIPAVQRLGYLGLQQPIEMYFLGAIYGAVLGGLSSYCRAFFGELVPPGFEAAFYALYAITDKGSSIFGPAVVGAITDRYGDIRPAFVFLAVLIFLPLPLLLLVDVDRGKAAAATLALELEGKQRRMYDGAGNRILPVIRLPDDVM